MTQNFRSLTKNLAALHKDVRLAEDRSPSLLAVSDATWAVLVGEGEAGAPWRVQNTSVEVRPGIGDNEAVAYMGDAVVLVRTW